MTKYAISVFIFLCFLASTVQAAFELKIDDVVRSNGSNYSIDVFFNLDGGTPIELTGLIATITTQNDGVTFIGIAPPNQDPLLASAVPNDYFGDISIPQTIIASVFPIGAPTLADDSIAFQLDFSVGPNVAFPIVFEFVNGVDPTITKYTVVMEATFREFTTRTNASITAVPEPTTSTLFVVAVGAGALWKRRRFRRSNSFSTATLLSN
jgi:hypothetical protein